MATKENLEKRLASLGFLDEVMKQVRLMEDKEDRLKTLREVIVGKDKDLDRMATEIIYLKKEIERVDASLKVLRNERDKARGELAETRGFAQEISDQRDLAQNQAHLHRVEVRRLQELIDGMRLTIKSQDATISALQSQQVPPPADQKSQESMASEIETLRTKNREIYEQRVELEKKLTEKIQRMMDAETMCQILVRKQARKEEERWDDPLMGQSQCIVFSLGGPWTSMKGATHSTGFEVAGVQQYERFIISTGADVGSVEVVEAPSSVRLCLEPTGKRKVNIWLPLALAKHVLTGMQRIIPRVEQQKEG